MLAAAPATTAAPGKILPQKMSYKGDGDNALSLHVFKPVGFLDEAKHSAIVIFHGGGWGGGKPETVYRFARYFAEAGYVTICVEYRLYRGGQFEVADCVRDARSAMRYVRSHAADFGVDAERIIACGYSAGGHLAIGTVVFDGVDDAGDDLAVSCRPSAVILYSAVLDTSFQGYGYGKLKNQWQKMSPLLHVKNGMPPVFVCHASGDKTVPYAGPQQFVAKAKVKGNDCVLLTLDEAAGHGSVLRETPYFNQVMEATTAFLRARQFTPDGTPVATSPSPQ